MISPSTRLRRAIHLSNLTLTTRLLRTHPTLLTNPDFTSLSNTSLHLAASIGHPAIVSHLLSLGHDATSISRNTAHDTPLILATAAGHLACAELLIRACPRSILLVNKRGLDVLAIATSTPASYALIPILLAHPTHAPSVHGRDGEGNSPLHHACAAGNLKALRILLEAGADPAARNVGDWTPGAWSLTVAAEVYWRNLVGEFERRRIEGLRGDEAREKARAGGVRVVEASREEDDEDDDEDVVIGDALRRHWNPVEARRPGTSGGGAGPPAGRFEFGVPLAHSRTRSGSGG